jgi:ATP-dependent Clp protease ATP-binding subunit ClpA
MQAANHEAVEGGRGQVGSDLILMAIVSVGKGIGAEVLRARGIDAETIHAAIAADPELTSPEPADELRDMLAKAMDEARRLEHLEFDEDHFLLAILADRLCDGCLILARLGVDLDETSSEIRSRIVPGPPGTIAHREAAPIRWRDHPRVRELKAAIEKLQRAKEEAVGVGHFEKAAALLDRRRPLEVELESLYRELDGQSQ